MEADLQKHFLLLGTTSRRPAAMAWTRPPMDLREYLRGGHDAGYATVKRCSITGRIPNADRMTGITPLMQMDGTTVHAYG